MLRVIAVVLVTLSWALCSAAGSDGVPLVSSPNGRVAVTFTLSPEGEARYSVDLAGQPVLQPSRLGLVREDADFSRGLRLTGQTPIERVTDDYELLTSKRKVNHYVANRRVVHLQGRNGEPLNVIFQVSDDGVAFRYEFSRASSKVHRLQAEASSFKFLAGTHAWLQPMAVAKSGWKGVNPSYEEIYERDIEAGAPPPTGVGWIYPALFKSGDVWLLVSEGSLPRNYAGTRLRSTWRSSEYAVAFPDPLEGMRGGPVNPESTLPWITPWRFIVIGTLKTIVESTLGTDLAEKPKAGSAPTPANGPGKASWSWPLLGDDQTNYAVQKRFIDYAADMGWQLHAGRCALGHADRLRQTEGAGRLRAHEGCEDSRLVQLRGRLERFAADAARPHAHAREPRAGVRAAEGHGRRGPEGGFLRRRRADRVIAYYRDILDDAAPYGFLMNFHGATLPRGWQRTYPNLMTMEAVRGLEFVTFEQKNAEDEPTHAAMLPFTRNVFDPMDFTPMVLDRIQRIERRTTSAFELALSVLFTSGIQHYAEIPEGMAKAPDYVREFLRHVPSVWDDVRFIDGFPGKHVVIARRAGAQWYVAGINAEPKDVTLDLDLSGLPGAGTLITDGDGGNLSFDSKPVQLTPEQRLPVRMKPRGGFVIVLGR